MFSHVWLCGVLFELIGLKGRDLTEALAAIKGDIGNIGAKSKRRSQGTGIIFCLVHGAIFIARAPELLMNGDETCPACTGSGGCMNKEIPRINSKISKD